MIESLNKCADCLLEHCVYNFRDKLQSNMNLWPGRSGSQPPRAPDPAKKPCDDRQQWKRHPAGHPVGLAFPPPLFSGAYC